jgi:hypothetical protein
MEFWFAKRSAVAEILEEANVSDFMPASTCDTEYPTKPSLASQLESPAK